MMTNWRRFFLSILFVAAVQGCATGPKLTQEQILDQYDQVAALDRELRDAAAQGVDNLAPDGYNAAEEQLQKAIAEAKADRGANANAAAAKGLQSLKRANEQADVSRDLLREVLSARDKAMQAGARSIFPERSADLDEEFRKVANLVERNRLEDAKERRPRLIAGYEQLELAALKEGTVEAAQAALKEAKEKDAEKFAPKTFKLAKEEMDLAMSVLEADRTRTEKANAHAKRAKYLAEQSAAVTELIKDFERRDFTHEDAVLWYQSQLAEAASPLDEKLPFNEPNRNVVLSLQQSIRDLMKQRDETAEQRSRYEQELSLTAEQRAAIDKVQSLFTQSEANVYQQRENVLISAHGFRFPSGGSKIEADNFGLMNKIIQAVKTFPEAQIEISGHTDSTGSPAKNKQLSQQRAENVARFLIEVGGISPSRIMATGYGSERPVASNETAEGRAANRRVEILINNS
jgi:outer membrane protein OmpA-like peptidoglycan-associated protein